MDVEKKQCLYCSVEDPLNLQKLQCSLCKQYVHSKCLRRGAVPGALIGDVFFQFICLDCSTSGAEQFVREKMSWLQVVGLVLYHMHHRCQGLSRKGYFHWKTHIVSFIASNWCTIFRKDVRPKKNWTGTVAGILSHYSPQFFMSGTSLLNEPGWWTLTYPKLNPSIISELNAEMLIEKQKCKGSCLEVNDISILKSILETKSYVTVEMLNLTTDNMRLILPTNQSQLSTDGLSSNFNGPYTSSYPKKNPDFISRKQKLLLPTIENINRIRSKKFKKRKRRGIHFTHLFKSQRRTTIITITQTPVKAILESKVEKQPRPSSPVEKISKSTEFFDYSYYYNTSIQNLDSIQVLKMKSRLVGRIQRQYIMSPYSYLSLPPYIWRTTSVNPPWLQLMDEIKARVQWKKYSKYKLRSRSTLDFMYFQPEHVAAVNALCGHYFWTGIDLSDALKYPDYTCVVLYKKLVVAFAIVVPNVDLAENYLSFIFTRPEWRNCGIAKFMLYHVIQACGNRDLTLHVSLSNPALCFYQKYGFKVEHIVLDFYDKFMRDGSRESKHAFFCRLER